MACIREITDQESDIFVSFDDTFWVEIFINLSYTNGMDLHSEVSTRHALQLWQSQQRADGRLAGALVFAAAVSTLIFVCAPSPSSAWVMGLFLFALGLSCLRLLNSTAMVVSRRECLQRSSAPPSVDAQLLDVYEHPTAPGALVARTTSALWLATPKKSGQQNPQPDFSSQLLRSGQHGRSRDRGRSK